MKEVYHRSPRFLTTYLNITHLYGNVKDFYITLTNHNVVSVEKYIIVRYTPTYDNAINTKNG